MLWLKVCTVGVIFLTGLAATDSRGRSDSQRFNRDTEHVCRNGRTILPEKPVRGWTMCYYEDKRKCKNGMTLKYIGDSPTHGTYWECVCNDGWTGMKCEMKNEHVCSNGGTVRISGTHGRFWSCICPHGWKGKRCTDVYGAGDLLLNGQLRLSKPKGRKSSK